MGGTIPGFCRRGSTMQCVRTRKYVHPDGPAAARWGRRQDPPPPPAGRSLQSQSATRTRFTSPHTGVITREFSRQAKLTFDRRRQQHFRLGKAETRWVAGHAHAPACAGGRPAVFLESVGINQDEGYL